MLLTLTYRPWHSSVIHSQCILFQPVDKAGVAFSLDSLVDPGGCIRQVRLYPVNALGVGRLLL